MHYYQHNIGDYRRDTGHLSLLEHGVYRQLLDMYYLSECRIPEETEVVYRRLSAKTNEEKLAVDTVLKEFFKPENGWFHARCDREISEYQGKADRARRNGQLGGRPSRTKVVIYRNQEQTDSKANHKPINPLTQEPSVDAAQGSATKRGTRIPQNWKLPKSWGDWTLENMSGWTPEDVRQEAASFHDFWLSKSGRDACKMDWEATWRNWCRNSKRKPTSSISPTGSNAMWYDTGPGIRKMGIELGAGDWDECTQWGPYRDKVFKMAKDAGKPMPPPKEID